MTENTITLLHKKGTMNEASIADPNSDTRLQGHKMYTPRSVLPQNLLRTPHCPKTPLSRRLTARRNVPQERAEEHSYEGLLRKTWRTYSLSPLYKFKSTKAAFTKYARSLDMALSQDTSYNNFTDEGGFLKSSFSLYEGLHFNSDAQAVQIQVTMKPESERDASIVLNAFLACVDLDGSPVPGNLSEHFTYYPVILISGSISRTESLLTWLEQHFDCHSAPVSFSNNDLRWMLAFGCCQAVSARPSQVLLQYSLREVCEGVSTIDCEFDGAFCKQLWERLNGGVLTRLSVDEVEVKQFVDALEQHLEYTMHIVFSKLSLSEVGTSMAYVSNQGKLKLLSSAGVFPTLHLICEIVKDRYLDITTM